MKKLLFLASIALMPALASAQSRQWFNLDPKADTSLGVSTERTYRELLKGRRSTPVVVAVIDGGVDTTHEDLRRVLWKNPKEVARNGRDDDNNGHADDYFGWNFIGGKDGRNVQYENTETTRLYKQLRPLYEGKERASLKPAQQKEYDRYVKLKADVEKKRGEYGQQYQLYSKIYDQLSSAVSDLKKGLNVTKLDTATLRHPKTQDQNLIRRAAAVDRLMSMQGITDVESFVTELKRGTEEMKARAEFQYNPDFDARTIVGDNPTNLTETNYGNADIMGPDPTHGTHVAGIIAADRTNQLGVMGVADQVRIMGVRVVPDGDERDKDVANGIRYAVDNGAQIINMSFGKDYSPQQKVVEDAVRYAESKGVLLVHAAGNDGNNLDSAANFPDVKYMNGQEIPNLLTIGASDRVLGEDMVASFSNYGRRSVDVFAPGKDIYSTTPSSHYEELSGTSMAAPVVSGVAAVLKSYFPRLTALDIKRVILQSAIPYKGMKVHKPKTGELVDFADLSKTGAIVNLYEAVKLAMAQESGAAGK